MSAISGERARIAGSASSQEAQYAALRSAVAVRAQVRQTQGQVARAELQRSPSRVAIAASQSAANWAVRAGGDVLFFTLTPFCCPRGPSAGRPKPGPDYAGMSGHAASKRRRADASARRSLRSGGSPSTLAAPESGRERRLVAKAADSGKGEQGGPPKHVSRYACTL